jgi:hypothetical protein
MQLLPVGQLRRSRALSIGRRMTPDSHEEQRAEHAAKQQRGDHQDKLCL